MMSWKDDESYTAQFKGTQQVLVLFYASAELFLVRCWHIANCDSCVRGVILLNKNNKYGVIWTTDFSGHVFLLYLHALNTDGSTT